MHIKIFEFNSLNFYKKNWVPFKTDVNLDGFITSFEKDLQFDQVSSQKKFKHTFEFPELDNKVGLFVIEFIANGYSSRAVVKKGTLSVIHKQRISGQIAYILDGNREICTGEDTGLYFGNQFFKSNPDKGGRIIIPYEKQTMSANAILVHNGYSQIVEFTRYAEKYTIEVAYIISPESLVMGNQATVVLRPCLKVNQRKCNLEPLSKTKVVITTTSFVDHVPISKTYEDISLKTDKDLELTFSVPANLESVSIDFETSIFNISQQKNEKLTSSHTINLKTNNSHVAFYESHLRKVDGKYIFFVLGKNGEPISNVDVLFNMTHCLYSAPKNQIQLTTNAMGTINLGALDGIKMVQSQIYLTTVPIQGSWQLSNTIQKNTFPERIEVLVGEEVEFPFIKAIGDSAFNEDTFSIVRLSFNNRHIENCFSKAKYTPPRNGAPSLVRISGLEPGYYHISFKECNISTHLTVHEGKYWKDESFILKKSSLMEFKTNKNVAYAKIRKIKHNPVDKKDEITIRMFNTNGSSRAHIMTTNFIPSNDLANFNSVKNVLERSIASEKFRFTQWKNVYLSNRKLGDEFRYVFDRKYLKRFRGNSLEKPQILLKRMKIRETSYDQEIVEEGERYASLDLKNFISQYPVEQRAFAESSYSQMNQMSNGLKRPYRFRPAPQQTRHSAVQLYSPSYAPTSSSLGEQYKSYLNFLKYPGILKANLVPDKAGNISFTVPSGKYSNLYILVSDKENVTHVHIDLPSQPEEIKTRDLSLVKPLDPKKHYNEVRNVLNFNKGDKHKIKDITSAEYTIIDSIEKVKSIQLEIAKMDGCSVCPDLLFLTYWNKLSYDDQVKKYTTYICHETNLFLYFKDRPFFEKVIKPFIVNKHEKSLIDHWLLGNYGEIEKYTTVEFFDNLNSVEKILLIYIVVQHDEETAKLLTERIKLNSEAVEENLEYRNVCFDAVINANYDEEKRKLTEADIEDLDEEIEENKLTDSLPLGAAARDTPPLSPHYGINMNTSRGFKAVKTIGGKGAKGVRNRKTRNAPDASKKRKRENKSDKVFAEEEVEEDYEDEIDYMFNEDPEERRKTRTNFQPMEKPSEY